jgi:ABC-2 type transport system ATP-binding protein
MLLSTVALSKRFDRHLALDSVNLQVREGEVYGLIGPNGAGKTTLLRLLALADEPTTGEVFLDGALLRYGEYLPQQKRRLGYLPDAYSVWRSPSNGHFSLGLVSKIPEIKALLRLFLVVFS